MKQMTTVTTLVRKLFRLVAFVVAASLAFAATKPASKIAPDIPQNNPWAMVDVIIQFKPSVQMQKLQSYGPIKKYFTGINAIHLTLPVITLQFLQSDPDVTYISPN